MNYQLGGKGVRPSKANNHFTLSNGFQRNLIRADTSPRARPRAKFWMETSDKLVSTAQIRQQEKNPRQMVRKVSPFFLVIIFGKQGRVEYLRVLYNASKPLFSTFVRTHATRPL